ncbi:hypothetical protein SAMN05660350_00447 [Geodermatophilus obscurus]|uniref:DUF4280 domain-containing protein n=1 Tax=Geodermatophilus obscurus TaxID=1861 RepID=A0A1M7S3G2_9ACTN|nr:hypothetical protein [Geodermatophilus obscurus]SHN52990.1 hypothetical protein SAMN05660350_00447 [Geodermatophilus obscurus]
MPEPLLHQGAAITCAHAGPAVPTLPSSRVLVAGQPVVTQAAAWTVAGCPLTPPASPCVTASFRTAATRVRVGRTPVLLADSQATCTPTGTGLLPLVVQPRVVGR